MTYDDLIDQDLFVKNHLDPQASFDGLLFETYGPEEDYVCGIAYDFPLRVATIVEGDSGAMYLMRGCQRINRVGYFVAKNDLPEFPDLKID